MADEIMYYAPKTISFSTEKYHYDGRAKKPKVTVFDSVGDRIDPSNYFVTYPTGRTKVGSYKVTVTFKKSSKKYEGKLSKSFVINPPKTKITKLTGGDKRFTVKWAKKKQVDGTTRKIKMMGTKARVFWSSSNTKVATVTKSGTVKAKKPGKTIITAKVKGKKYTCKVHVMKSHSKRLDRMAAMGIDLAYNSVDYPTTLHVKEISYDTYEGPAGEKTMYDTMVIACYSMNAYGGMSLGMVTIYRSDYVDYEGGDILYQKGYGYFQIYYQEYESSFEGKHKYGNKRAVKAYQDYYNTNRKIPYA